MNFEKINISKKAVCLDVAGEYTKLTLAEEYEILDEGPGRFTVRDDTGKIHSYDRERFAVIKEGGCTSD